MTARADLGVDGAALGGAPGRKGATAGARDSRLDVLRMNFVLHGFSFSAPGRSDGVDRQLTA